MFNTKFQLNEWSEAKPGLAKSHGLGINEKPPLLIGFPSVWLPESHEVLHNKEAPFIGNTL